MKNISRITAKNLFLMVVIFLIFLPILTGLSELLTSILAKTPIYLFIQNNIVSHEVSLVGTILSHFNVPVAISKTSLSVNGQPLEVTWNCLGWQSFLFLMITMLAGFEKKYSTSSKIQAIIVGVLGTFWVNITRMLLVSILAGYLPSIFPYVFHNYLASFMTLGWLLVFWWFSYQYILDDKTSAPSQRPKDSVNE